jgi:hypothetical protein
MSSQPSDSNNYRSYLLRLVRAREGGSGWRIRLQEARSGQAHSFKDLAELIDFLNSELGGNTGATPESPRRNNES